MARYEEKIAALAEYLDVDPSEIKEGYTLDLFETPDGEEYYVTDYDGAYDLAVESIKSTFDDLGLDAFTPSFRDWILSNAVDENFIDELIEEEASYLRDELDDEDRAVEIENYSFDDKVDYLVDSLGGYEYFANLVTKNNAFDLDEIADEAISEDGIAHFIAYYDGDEIELSNNLYAYRVN